MTAHTGVMKTRYLHISTIALNFALREDGQPPEWVLLVPAGEFAGADGRRYINRNAGAIIDGIVQRAIDVPWDAEHATEIKAPKGEEAGAKGWTKSAPEDFEVRDGALWGRVSFNAKGREMVTGEEYRYYSPAFYCLKDTNPAVIIGIKSVGLTNTPNLELTALNTEAMTMDKFPPEVLAALGLPETATTAEVVAAIKALQAEKDSAVSMNRQLPDMTQYVPKATYELTLNRATTAEATLAAKTQAERDGAITTAIEAAIAAGKIAPANKDFYISACRAEGGLEQFKAFAAAAPVIVGASGLDGKVATNPATVSLNAEERYVAQQLGISEEDYAKAKETK